MFAIRDTYKDNNLIKMEKIYYVFILKTILPLKINKRLYSFIQMYAINA